MNNGNATSMVEVDALVKTFRRGETEIAALRGIHLTIEKGSRTAIMGPSGGGKSTLLALIGGLDRPTSGSVRVNGQTIKTGRARDMALLRRTTIGYILQTPSLLPMLTARENIELPLALNGADRELRFATSRDLLEEAGLWDKADALPDELSGGQQQRIAVMRAMASRPALLLADEPTGSLDSATGAGILELITRIVTRDGITLLMVTHDEDNTRYVDRTIRIRDGAIEGLSK